jgi:hypothetical protein
VYPAYLLFSGLGLYYGGSTLCAWCKWPLAAGVAARGILFPIALLLYAYPAWLAHHWVGPYKMVIEWADRSLPRGTPILCDRYFTAWNEFPANSPTRVAFMSTKPNQLPEQYQNGDWRSSAMSFLKNNPDAAFFEQRMHWDRFGPWQWPHSWFVKKVVLVDEFDLKLRRMGMRYTRRTKKKRDTGEVAVYYNSPEDLLHRAKVAGEPLLILYHQGWRYAKSEDGKDWRRMDDRATLELYNLTNHPLTATLEISGVAVGGDKTISSSLGGRIQFADGQPTQWRITDLRLTPGRNELTLLDPNAHSKMPMLLVNKLSYMDPKHPQNQ